MARGNKSLGKREKVKSSEMLPFDLVAMDVDGTLLNSEHEVTRENLAAIDAVRAAGVMATLVTGRSVFSLKLVLEQFELDIPYICSGGAEIIDPIQGEQIDRRVIARGDLEFIVNTARESNAAMFFTLSDGIYYEASPGSMEGLKPSRGYHLTEIDDILSDHSAEPTKVAIYGDPDKLKKIEIAIRNHGANVHMAYPLESFLDVTREDANKGAALIRLINHLQIPQERVLAIGDADNDLSMFDVAGMSIAMGNATSFVKAAADKIVPSNDENGVAWALREVVLNEEIDR
jgi:Cof subfamily protein (haloacid dehalogenase superfamily)